MRLATLSLLIVSLSVAFAHAQKIKLSARHFQSEDFRKSFAASYGFLSPVEPKVDAEESEILTEAGEMFRKGQFRAVESKLADFVRARQSPDPDDAEGKPKGVSPAMVFVLGNLYFQNEQYARAERAYIESIRRFPSFRRAHKNLAMLYAVQNKMEKALPSLNKAIQLGDTDHRSFGMLGYCYLQREEPVAAETAYRQASLLNPAEKDWKTGLVQALVMQEKWQASLAMLEMLVKEAPDKKSYWELMVNCRLSLGEKMKAARTIEVMRHMGLADARLLKLLGDIYMDQSQPVLALGAYMISMKKTDGESKGAGLAAARILLDYGALEESAKYLHAYRVSKGAALTKDEKREIGLLEARGAEKRGKLDEAVRFIDALLTSDPMNGEALVFLGRLHEQRAQSVEADDAKEKAYHLARVSFRRALSIKGSEYDANLRYGQMLVRRLQFESGLPYLKRAQSLKPDNKNLTRYVRRVEAAANRAKLRREGEEKARAIRQGKG